MIGAHSVIDRPLPVRRVAAPMRAVAATMSAMMASQSRTARVGEWGGEVVCGDVGGMGSGVCGGGGATVSG